MPYKNDASSWLVPFGRGAYKLAHCVRPAGPVLGIGRADQFGAENLRFWGGGPKRRSALASANYLPGLHIAAAVCEARAIWGEHSFRRIAEIGGERALQSPPRCDECFSAELGNRQLPGADPIINPVDANADLVGNCRRAPN